MDEDTDTAAEASEPPADASEAPSDAPEPSADSPTCLCPLGEVMDLLSRRYAMQVVCVVDALGPVRYGDIAAAFGSVSSSTLSTRLDDLVAAGLLVREQYAEIPPRVEYDLTDDGAVLAERLRPLLAWAEEREATLPE